MRDIQDSYPLSPLQQGMLLHTLFAPQTGIYINQLSCALTGELNASAFAQAWQQVIDRHAILRSSFVWKEIEKPVQIVQQRMALSLQQHDWRESPPNELGERLEAYLREDRKHGFDLSKAPLMRLALIREGDDEYHFIWTFHHLLLDDASISLILKDLFAYYDGVCQGKEFNPRPRPLYRDYITWLQRQDQSKVEAFWRQTLNGFTAPTALRIDHTRVELPVDANLCDHQHLQLSVELTAALESFAREHQLTMSTVMQACWALTLSLYSGERDVVFGNVVSYRPSDLAGAEEMVGLLINTLPVRVQIPLDTSLLTWIKGLQDQQSRASEYAYSSLSQVQGCSDVGPGQPLFDSIFAYESNPFDASIRDHSLQPGSLKALRASLVEETNYLLSLVVRPGERLSLSVSYDCSRVDATTINRLIGHAQNTLASMVANPDERLATLSPLGPDERQQLLVEWNQTQSEFPLDQRFHEMFEDHAEQLPEALALVMERKHLSYGNLNKKANQLAHHLQSLGVGPEVRVGILVERSLEMVVGLLAIIKAGGAYVPLDPAYPQDRIRYMLDDSKVSVLLTQEQLIAQLPGHKARVVCIDRDWDLIAEQPDHNLQVPLSPDNLVYVIYTSGSTGRPKGVAIKHRNLTSLVRWAKDLFSVEDLSGLLASSSISFDLSVFELFAPLSSGGKIILVENAFQVFTMANPNNVTYINTVPSVMAVLLEHGGLPRSVRTLSTGGELLKNSVVQQAYQYKNIRKFINLYGPTEDTVYSTYKLMERGASEDQPFGRPIPDTQIYLLDQYQKPVPIGVPGEVYLSGDGLARGYLDRPDLTAERFIPNPFGDAPGDRLYKSGDVARYLPNGDLAFVERIDHQVKVRGFRIELGEVESVLEQHSAVKEAVVKPWAEGLIAYFVPNQDEAPSSVELRKFLQEKLPQYMVPSIFVHLDEWPVTPNGKLDRKALPNPSSAHSEPEAAFTAPQTKVERAIAKIWQEALNTGKVGAHDSFFELGGHSLSLLQVHSKLEMTFGKEISLIELFKSPTINEMAKHFTQEQLERPSFDGVYDRAKRQKEALAQQKERMKERIKIV